MEAILLGDRVMVMAGDPGRVKDIVPVNIPRPRPPRNAGIHGTLAETLRFTRDKRFGENGIKEKSMPGKD